MSEFFNCRKTSKPMKFNFLNQQQNVILKFYEDNELTKERGVNKWK